MRAVSLMLAAWLLALPAAAQRVDSYSPIGPTGGTVACATAACNFVFNRSDATLASGQVIGNLNFTGNDTGGNAITWGTIRCLANTSGATSANDIGECDVIAPFQGSNKTATMIATVSGINFNIGAITGANISVTSNSAPGVGIYRPGTNQLGFSTNTLPAGMVDANQHWRIGFAGAPTIGANACGSTSQGTVAAGSTDHSGFVTVGTIAVTACTVTFNKTYTTAPSSCRVSPADSTALATSGAYVAPADVGTANFVIRGTTLAGVTLSYWCE